MIKFIKQNGMTMLEADGTLVKLAADVAFMVSQIYHRIGDERAKRQFKQMMQVMVIDSSPIWDEKTVVRGQVDISRTVDMTELCKQAEKNDGGQP